MLLADYEFNEIVLWSKYFVLRQKIAFLPIKCLKLHNVYNYVTKTIYFKNKSTAYFCK